MHLEYTMKGITHTIPYVKHNLPANKIKDLGDGNIQFVVSPTQNETRDALVELLRVWIEFSNTHEVEWWAHSGTLIGALRHNGLIPWDNDIDLGIKLHDYKRIREITGPDYEVEFVPGYILIKAFAGFRIRKVGHWLPFMDIFVCDVRAKYPLRLQYAGPIAYRIDGTYHTSFYASDYWSKEWIDVADLDSSKTSLPTLAFEGIDIPVPHNALEIIKRHYGADVMQNMYYSESTNGRGHSPAMRVFIPIESNIDIFHMVFENMGFDAPVIDGHDDYRTNLSRLISMNLLHMTQSDLPDTASIYRALLKTQNDWIRFLLVRMLQAVSNGCTDNTS